MRVLGIDVGINGAAAIYAQADPGLNRPHLFDLPVIGQDAQREIDVRALAKEIRPFQVGHAFIEHVWAMPSMDRDGKRVGMAANAAWRFGFAIGQIRATVALLGIPITLVIPPKWMKLYGLKGGIENKESHRQKAIQLMPDCADNLHRKKDHQRADALLIARYGWLLMNGGDHGGRGTGTKAGAESTSTN